MAKAKRRLILITAAAAFFGIIFLPPATALLLILVIAAAAFFGILWLPMHIELKHPKDPRRIMPAETIYDIEAQLLATQIGIDTDRFMARANYLVKQAHTLMQEYEEHLKSHGLEEIPL